MDVVLGPGWPGVLLHEAVGHGLEGDFNRKKTSAFAGLMGEQVAAPGVTVVDDGTIPSAAARSPSTTRARRPAQRADRGRQARRLHAGPAERPPDGHEADRQRPPRILRPPADAAHDQHLHAGRRQDPEEIIASVKNGIYAVSFGGGQVDITSGKFVFGCTEAYMIEDGKVGPRSRARC
jgi:TldD protein